MRRAEPGHSRGVWALRAGIQEEAEVRGRLASELVLKMETDRQRWGKFRLLGVSEEELGYGVRLVWAAGGHIRGFAPVKTITTITTTPNRWVFFFI